MCGIVGHLGARKSYNVLIEGLSRLEYRGYDSAGVSLKSFGEKSFSTHKAVGKLKNLKDKTKDKEFDQNMGISHTRWATHGEVNQVNSHPHENDYFSIVHNGIVENYSELKSMLEKEGLEFKSQTDTEVYLNLLTKTFKDLGDIEQSIIESFKLIKGNSVFIIMSKEHDSIYAIRKNSPLVVGIDQTKDLYVSSDAYALVGFAKDVFFPENDVLCKLDSETMKVTFRDLELNDSDKVEKKDLNLFSDISQKGDFEHYMLKEIHEQPKLIREFIDYYFKGLGIKSLEKFCNDFCKQEYEMIHIIGCGTAFHAGLVIKNYIEMYLGVPCNVELASEFRYRNPLLKTNHASIFISQSGETADTLAAQKLCKEKGLYTVGIINTYGSSLYRSCDLNLLINAGQEIGVASTKAFTLQALTGYLMATLCSEKLKKNTLTKQNVQARVNSVADSIEDLLKNTELKIKEVSEKLYDKNGFIFTGRGRNFPAALEGALKLKEIAYVHAEGYAAGELKHGPIAMIDQNMCNICLMGNELFEKMLSNIEEVKARHGIIVIIGSDSSDQKNKLKDVYDYFIGCKINHLDDLDSLITNVVNQLFSYYLAKFKGTDIDQPRNLAKSVTVE